MTLKVHLEASITFDLPGAVHLEDIFDQELHSVILRLYRSEAFHSSKSLTSNQKLPVVVLQNLRPLLLSSILPQVENV